MLIAELSNIGVSFPRLLVLAGVITAIAIAASAMFVLSTKRQVEDRTSRNSLSRLIYAGFVVMVGGLSVTSFGSILAFGHLAGYALLAHLAAGGSFVFLLLAVSTLYLPRGVSPGHALFTADQRWWVARWSAWLLVLSGLVTAGTMFLSMLPILDTDGLVKVAALHSYSGLVAVIATVVHVFALICTQRGWR